MSRIQPRPMPSLQDWIDRKPSGPKPRRPMRRTRLKPRSAKKQDWHELYILGLKFLLSLDPMCRRCRKREATDGHHIFGRANALMLLFTVTCRRCHNAVHGNPNKARRDGWLF